MCIKGGQRGGRSTIQAGPSCCIIILACSLRQRAEENRDRVSLVWAVPSSPGLLTHRTSVFSVAVSRPKPPNKWPSQGFQFSAFFLLFTLFFWGNRVRPTLHKESQGPRLNSNQAFPLIQKLKLAWRDFTLGVKAKVQLKSSIPIGAKVEINPKGHYTRSHG